MLFIDCSSTFNTIVPLELITKLRSLELNTSLCNWILDFLTGPLRCVLSPLLYSLFAYNLCGCAHIKIADDTMVVGLITDNDETAYREKVRDLAVWCQDSNFSLDNSETKELILDYRNWRVEPRPHSHRGCSGAGRELQVLRCPYH
jgi:hypothetical protein